MNVQFTDLSINAVSWLWDFGDSSPLSTLENPLHHFDSNIVYNVKLTVWDAFGNSDSITQPVDLTEFVTEIVQAFV